MPPEYAIVHHLNELKSCPSVYPITTRATVDGDIVKKVAWRFAKFTERRTIPTMRILSASLIRLFVFMVVGPLRWNYLRLKGFFQTGDFFAKKVRLLHTPPSKIEVRGHVSGFSRSCR